MCNASAFAFFGSLVERMMSVARSIVSSEICGKSACTVRREGERQLLLPLSGAAKAGSADLPIRSPVLALARETVDVARHTILANQDALKALSPPDPSPDGRTTNL
jgi:hypothetical protein